MSIDDQLGLPFLADGICGLYSGEVASSMSVYLLVSDQCAYLQGSFELESEMEDNGLPLKYGTIGRE